MIKQSNKNIRTLQAVTIVISFLFMGALVPIHSHAGEPDRPYKATTVDECIQEKECVWYAFSNQLGLLDHRHRPRADRKIHKWKEPLRILVTGDGKKYTPGLVEVVNQLNIFFLRE
ncbi:MAG: hypothetical protein DHS20C02_20320 [Micavibrio sp.]|nr:MAG: hypothetical protein DHS20C02_20320 [Micavibrio sp.]